MKTKNNLLEKYYRGETTLEEEAWLKQEFSGQDTPSAEKDIFGFYDETIPVPENLEEQIMEGWEAKRHQKQSQMKWLISLSSAAAAIVLAVSIFFHLQKVENTRIENQFFVMEQALYSVSETLQPQEQEEMLVLWVDENVEIIINQ